MNSEEVGGALPQDVVRLVIAAREVAFGPIADSVRHEPEFREIIKKLDAASEAFADRVPWADEPGRETPPHPERLMEAREIAGKLTKASRRALQRIGRDWTFEGAPGPKREDAYSLWWGRDGKFRLIEPRSFAGRWKYRLTPLGQQVATILQEHPNG